MNLFKCLEELSNSNGVSGNEDETIEIAEKYFKKHVHETQIDKTGNLLGFKKGQGRSSQRPRLLFAAHADEIGLMITRIEETGFLRFTTIGGFDLRTLWGQEVTVHGKDKLWGVIGPKPPHLISPEEKKKEIKLEELYIDMGLSLEEVNKLVKVGDFVSLHREFTSLADRDHVSGKALDDRAGVAGLLLCAQELSKFKHTADVYFVCTVQEEVGARGALTSTYKVEPDAGVAVDVCHGNMPSAKTSETFKLGKGPVLGYGPNIHPLIYQKLKEAAESYHLPYMVEPHPGPTPTDARSIQITREGVASGLASIPLRYMHTSVELASLKDIEMLARLLALFAASFDYQAREELQCYY